MESIDNGSILSPETEAQKSQPIQASGEGSFSGGLQASGDKMWRNVVYRSIRTVVFSNKLNMLMPFGPLAIFVHIFTGHNVSCNSPFLLIARHCSNLLLIYGCESQGWVFFLTLLGITPLAERLGYATEYVVLLPSLSTTSQ